MTAALKQYVTRYPCARCGRHDTADRMTYSRVTGNRYCRDHTRCDRRAKRRSTTPTHPEGTPR